MVLKIIICGDSLVGKTALRKKFFRFGPISYTNIGYEFSFKDIIWQKGPLAGQSVKVHAFEMSSEERFRSIRPWVFRGSNAAFLIYDITNPQSFDNLVNWLEEIITNEGIIHLS